MLMLSFFSKHVSRGNTCICSKEERNKQHSDAFKNLKTRISEARVTTWLLYHKCNANQWIYTTVCWLLMDKTMFTFTSTSAKSFSDSTPTFTKHKMNNKPICIGEYNCIWIWIYLDFWKQTYQDLQPFKKKKAKWLVSLFASERPENHTYQGKGNKN